MRHRLFKKVQSYSGFTSEGKIEGQSVTSLRRRIRNETRVPFSPHVGIRKTLDIFYIFLRGIRILVGNFVYIFT